MITLKILCDRCKKNKLEVDSNNLNLAIKAIKNEAKHWKVGFEGETTFQVCPFCVNKKLTKGKQ